MRLCPCRFNVPLTDNEGQPIDPQVIVALHRELLEQFGGFTIHPTSLGRWQNLGGRLYQEEIVVYEAAVGPKVISALRDVVSRLGRQLGQLAMYFDAPQPSVEIIDLTELETPSTAPERKRNEPRKSKAARRRGKRNRPTG